MKTVTPLLAILLLVASLAPAGAQDQDTQAAAAAAARQDAEERYKRLNAAVEDLITAQAAQQKKIAELAGAIAALREDVTRTANSNTTRDELRSLAEKVQEIEKNREADKKLILKEIEKLGKRPSPAAQANTPPVERAEKGYEYVVQPGDNFSVIAAAYQKEGIKVTKEMIQKANPKLESTKLKIGQKIFIPQP